MSTNGYGVRSSQALILENSQNWCSSVNYNRTYLRINLLLISIEYFDFVNDNKRGGVETMAQEILCEVNNCTFWDSGNKCTAEKIYVVSQKGQQASNSEETDCKTFEPDTH